MGDRYIPVDEKKVNKAQRIYDSSVDQYLEMIEKINDDIPEIVDILHGIAMGREEPKYQITKQQHSAMKDQLNIWKANIHNPEKVLSHIHGELKKRYAKADQSNNQQSSNQPNIAVFSKFAE